MRHLPNILTVLRLLGTVPVVYLILDRNFHLALVVSFLIAVTDSVDGWIARHYRYESKFGALVDPLADKVLVGSGLLALLYVGAVPLWLVISAIVRDLGIALVAGLLHWKTGRTEFPPSRLGKLNTFVLMCTVAAVFLDFYTSFFFVLSGIMIGISALRYAQLAWRYANSPSPRGNPH